jgi:hypothetical protein
LAAVLAGANASVQDVTMAADEAFQAGSFHTGPALAHCHVRDGVVELTGGGFLGSDFDAHLRGYDADTLCEIVKTYHDGFDAITECTPKYLERVMPSDPTEAAAHHHRDVSRHQNSPTCQDFVNVLKEQNLDKQRQGAVRCLGKIADVQREGRMPADLGKIVVEPSKPRLCHSPRSLNLATADHPFELEGLDVVRSMCQDDDGVGAVVDEKAGYCHHRLSDASTSLFGYLLLGYVWIYLTVPFGYKLGVQCSWGRSLLSLFRPRCS